VRRKRKQNESEPEKVTVRPPDRLFLAWGIYWAPELEVKDAEAYGYPMCPWVAQAHLALALCAARSGFHLMNTFWGHDEESAEEAIKLALSHAEVHVETVALFAMGYPKERLIGLGQGEGKHLAIADVPIEGKPPFSRDSLLQLPRAGW